MFLTKTLPFLSRQTCSNRIRRVPELTQWIRPEASLSGKARWRGGNMDMARAARLNDDIVTQLLAAALRAVISAPASRAHLARVPARSVRISGHGKSRKNADAITRREAITIYGDYDVDGATSGP
jgi:single-stranded-DNA-specific exonuclease